MTATPASTPHPPTTSELADLFRPGDDDFPCCAQRRRARGAPVNEGHLQLGPEVAEQLRDGYVPGLDDDAEDER